MLVGYARVSTFDQHPGLQIDALQLAGCERIFTEHASGAQRSRPEQKAALDDLRPGDTLMGWKLDRLARAMRQLIETLETLQARQVELRSLTAQIDTATAGGRRIFHLFGALAAFERAVIRERTRQACRQHGRALRRAAHPPQRQRSPDGAHAADQPGQSGCRCGRTHRGLPCHALPSSTRWPQWDADES